MNVAEVYTGVGKNTSGSRRVLVEGRETGSTYLIVGGAVSASRTSAGSQRFGRAGNVDTVAILRG